MNVTSVLLVRIIISSCTHFAPASPLEFGSTKKYKKIGNNFILIELPSRIQTRTSMGYIYI
jgi:hypothetical protein